ncbi:permease prefix domain 1-containing protein [Microbacterium sp. zg-YB36]|uniref:permease prefix domain 1-containing protein n=1 Tax=Microbacterium sp. zg-YB36 TaxID=2969407 RepID=UPI00214C3708|nr:permease prefix domain 1-containing protein [Microbacterium sp. zg-YB36]MDL5351474.1 permease prefix domain 1-containing protein [Microbacterium sp. zg-YB36]
MTVQSTFTDRYVDAATRSVPEKQRPDLAAELRASIEDQVDARAASGQPPADAERAVLSELGDPERLAAGYTDRPLHLIGPRLYLDWLRVLKLLLWIVLPLAAIGFAVGAVLAGGEAVEMISEVIGGVIGGTLSVGIHVAFWVTLAFAIADRALSGKSTPFTAWTVDQLREVRPAGQGLGDLIASLVFVAIAAGAVIWDQVTGVVYLQDQWMPMLDPRLWPWGIAALLVLLAAEAALAVAVYVRGRWTWPFVVANAGVALAVAVPALVLLGGGMLVNPAFFPGGFPALSDQAASISAAALGIVIVGVAAWDIIDAALKARRAR